jgi:tRNA A-37 threonylcarbamoyl transferase component Bud32
MGPAHPNRVPSLRTAPPWLYLVALSFCAYFALLLYCDFKRPEDPGVVARFDSQGMWVAAVSPGSPAERAGVRTGNHVVTALERPIRSRLDWLAVESNLRPDTTLTLTIDGPSARQVRVPLASPERRRWLRREGVALLVARVAQTITLLIGLLVAFRRPEDAGAQLGAWVLVAVGVFCVVPPYGIASVWRALPAPIGALMWLPWASTFAIAAILLTFFARFPQTASRHRWLLPACWALMGAALAWHVRFTWGMIYRPRDSLDVSFAAGVILVLTVVFIVGGFALLAGQYRDLPGVTNRRRARVIFFGSVVGLGSALAVVLLYWARPDADVAPSLFSSGLFLVGTITSLVFPASLEYAILRHRLFDVGAILRQGLQYALARRVLVSLVPGALVLLSVDLLLHANRTVGDILASHGWIYLLLIAGAIVGRLRRDAWLDALDRRFFRERYNAQQLLRQVAEDCRRASWLGEAAPHVVTSLEAALHPTFVALFLRNQEQSTARSTDVSRDVYRAVAEAPAGDGVDAISARSVLLKRAATLSRPIVLTPEKAGPLLLDLPDDDRRWLEVSGLELLAHVSAGEEFVSDAYLALGCRRSEEPYSADDQDLVAAIAESLSLLLKTRPAVPPQNAKADVLVSECPACGACYDPAADRCERDGSALTPTRLPRLLGGRYIIERRLARGGMGSIYVAFDSSPLERRVAIKVLRDDLIGDRHAAERFVREARLSAFPLPNVVPVHDFGTTADGLAFLVMELLAGQTLRAVLQTESRLDSALALHVAQAIGETMTAAHSQGLIHRDLKPENVFLLPSPAVPRVRLLDFGLAKAISAGAPSSFATGAEVLLGTPEYMAPEQLRGREPQASWDLWSLAVMMFEMLTGELPFATTFAEADVSAPAHAHLETRLGSGFSHLTRFFTWALAADPARRPPSAEILVAKFEEALETGESKGASISGRRTHA